jgi:hypothetical protein
MRRPNCQARSVAYSEEPNCPNPDDHIEPRRSALFLARSVLGAYSDGRHQCLFDIITRGQKNQRYRRPFRCVMNLRWSWQNATERLSKLSGNGANATVLGITAPRLQTTRTPAQEVVAVALRKTLLWSLDGLLTVGREFLNPTISRSGLGLCLRRHGLGRLCDLKAKNDTHQHSGLKTSEPKYIHIDVKFPPHIANETSREISLWRSTGPTNGSSLPRIATKQPLMPSAF